MSSLKPLHLSHTCSAPPRPPQMWVNKLGLGLWASWAFLWSALGRGECCKEDLSPLAQWPSGPPLLTCSPWGLAERTNNKGNLIEKRGPQL
jgi:hypothetical protein